MVQDWPLNPVRFQQTFDPIAERTTQLRVVERGPRGRCPTRHGIEELLAETADGRLEKILCATFRVKKFFCPATGTGKKGNSFFYAFQDRGVVFRRRHNGHATVAL